MKLRYIATGRYRIVGTDYEIARGSYHGTQDDNARTWYVDHIDDKTMDRRGSGHATRAEAVADLLDTLEQDRFLDRADESDLL